VRSVRRPGRPLAERLAPAWAALGELADVAWAEGLAMTQEQAAAYALDAPLPPA
jgi:hypothetical protein